ncbi:heavy metal-associated isoprenylated plant protein 47-like isoform X5 [Argentina anserina]|uniref:heavy metal-associated isoprenylated plant protein 47-like isoform X4 n=1 Tax=Argentina anserina TaxID=57926 RepID=UPI0021764A19|nr:heavy metal-associated isoprenylated plant protein 47-like isoform X4 [Potentilla anserina]XP_050370916.1 heavy metal-associated isoprenylated plant protein 47-like isoform X5 [Potentilla anserina]
MKQKIVMKMQFISEKRRTDAFKIAAGTTEPDKDQLVVIGDGVDSVCLTKALRKKLRCVEIVSVAEVKKPEDEKKPAAECIPIQWTSSYVHYPMHYDLVYRW